MEKTIQHLLSQISLINKKHDDIAKITGEHFNLFEILKVTTSETRTHSAFLAALLDPKGKHGLGSIMLKHFLNIVGFENFDVDTARVSIERGIGYISQDYKEGGRVDILIENGQGQGILIENKIYAADQKMQLLRYYNYAQPRYKNGWKLFYLNLNGNSPSDISTGNELKQNEHYEIISYKDTITSWLDECKKEAANYPILRETITQYNILIKNLTNQSTNKKMEQEIINQLIQSEETMDAAFKIMTSISATRKHLFELMKTDLIKWAEGLNYKIEEENDWGGGSESYIVFHHSDIEKVFFFFGFEKGFNGFSVGVEFVNKETDDYAEKCKEIKARLTPIFGLDKGWQKYAYFHFFEGDWANWEDRRMMWREIISGKTQERFKNWITQITEQLKKVGL